jgi:cytidyltransferase-like protein
LEQAKKLGDILVVGVVSDRFFKKREQTFFNEKERLEFVEVLECVDFAILNDAPDAIETITQIMPDIYAKGEDVRKKAMNPSENLYKEIGALLTLGGEIHFTKSLPVHTSDLLAKLADVERRAEIEDKLFNPLLLPKIISSYDKNFRN